MPKSDASAKILMVEGNSDYHVLKNLKRSHGIPEAAFEIRNMEGIDNLLPAFGLTLEDLVECIGIVVDADSDIEKRWKEITSFLKEAKYSSFPSEPDRNGTIIVETGLPKVGVWIMPDNTVPGIFEDFVRFLVPPGNAMWEHAAKCVSEVPEFEDRFPEKDRSKAVAYTWLAWKEDPGTPMGWAVTKKYLDANAPPALALVAWMKQLFL